LFGIHLLFYFLGEGLFFGGGIQCKLIERNPHPLLKND
jgi:hypothetical protein